MSLKEISDTSIVASLFRYFYRLYERLEQKAIYLYQVSQTYRLIQGLCKKIKIIFRYSFLGRIIETKQTSSKVLENSRIVQYFIRFYKRWKDKIANYSRTSSTVVLVKDTKEGLNFSAVRTVSVIVGTTVIVNAVLSLVLQKQIGLWGWLMRGLFLFVACAGLSCKADWSTIKRNSILLRKIRMD